MQHENELFANMLNRIYITESTRSYPRITKFDHGSAQAFSLIKKTFINIAENSFKYPKTIVAFFTIADDHTFFSCNGENVQEVNFSKNDLLGCVELAKRNGLRTNIIRNGKNIQFTFAFTPSNA